MKLTAPPLETINGHWSLTKTPARLEVHTSERACYAFTHGDVVHATAITALPQLLMAAAKVLEASTLKDDTSALDVAALYRSLPLLQDALAAAGYQITA